MGLMENVQNAGQRAKLNGEMLLIDRDIVARKKEFGVELYDLIDIIERKSKTSMLSTPSLFKGIESQIQEYLEVCRKEVGDFEDSKSAKELEQTQLEVKRERETKATIGKWMSRTGTDAKLTVEITMLERQIKQRKEKFGVDIWDIVAQPSSIVENVNIEAKKKSGLGKVTGALTGLTKGVTSSVANGLGKLSSDERTIQVCVEKAREDVDLFERSKARKLGILASLAK
jgi:hypothetical protein